MNIGELINVRLSDDGNAVVIIDQTLLPNEEKYLTLTTPEQMYEAIYMLRVRGAPAIGIFAAYALYVLAGQIDTGDFAVFAAKVNEYSAYLNSTRPTAVNLQTQLRRLTDTVNALSDLPIHQIIEAMRIEAEKIYDEDVQMCSAISRHGLSLIRGGVGNAGKGGLRCDDSTLCESFGVMTVCNAGPLATSKYGTALGPIILGHEQGMKIHAYICETRPLLQGARLTAYELDRAGVECTLICDNMASAVMSQGKINAVFAGCDRIAANGDVANKIGTSSLAILAKHYGIPFYVFGPSTTIDLSCPSGADIEIELRRPEEIKKLHFSKPMAPARVKCYNPAFDVTPRELITAIITEKGVLTGTATAL
ncbi:MAG: S-methyl-5-thioribose-1-phosphate isomerase [Oscillospiraceae bacterium]|nr:S-methyl-5-thioribose-1-phosphate isomerase [Oscillospiraceae bacterium]